MLGPLPDSILDGSPEALQCRQASLDIETPGSLPLCLDERPFLFGALALLFGALVVFLSQPALLSGSIVGDLRQSVVDR